MNLNKEERKDSENTNLMPLYNTGRYPGHEKLVRANEKHKKQVAGQQKLSQTYFPRHIHRWPETRRAMLSLFQFTVLTFLA